MNQIIFAILGCGNVAQKYARLFERLQNVSVKSCFDLNQDRLKEFCNQIGSLAASHKEEIIADPEVDIVLNLTPPQEHFDLTRSCLLSGKHVYSEKPLAISSIQGQELHSIAVDQERLLGVAPDTIFGPAFLVARQVLNAGLIGKPISVMAEMMHRGSEAWHPNPELFYQRGAGPVFDMGPYYISWLVHLFGAVTRVSALSSNLIPQRRIQSGPKSGDCFDSEVDTHVNAALLFANGAIANFVSTFDAQIPYTSRLDIFGTSGALQLSDPDDYDGDVYLFDSVSESWEKIHESKRWAHGMRGVGIFDFLDAIKGSEKSYWKSAADLHVLEILEAICNSADIKQHVPIHSSFEPRDSIKYSYAKEVGLYV